LEPKERDGIGKEKGEKKLARPVSQKQRRVPEGNETKTCRILIEEREEGTTKD